MCRAPTTVMPTLLMLSGTGAMLGPGLPALACSCRALGPAGAAMQLDSSIACPRLDWPSCGWQSMAQHAGHGWLRQDVHGTAETFSRLRTGLSGAARPLAA